MTRRRLVHVSVAGAIGLSILLTQTTSAQRGGPLRIYVARHGQTDWNVEGRLQGGIDTKLNDTGREQARELREKLKGVRLDAVYSSALSRSRETAEIVHGSVRLTSLEGLNERGLGKFEGQKLSAPTTGGTPTTAPATDSEITREYVKRTADPDDTLDGGESLNQVSARVGATVDTILKKHQSGAVLLVGHGLTNKMVLRRLLNLTLEQANAIQQANDEVYLIEIDRGSAPRVWKLITTKTLSEL